MLSLIVPSLLDLYVLERGSWSRLVKDCLRGAGEGVEVALLEKTVFGSIAMGAMVCR